MIEKFKTLIVYWVLAGVVSAVINVLWAVSGYYTDEMNAMSIIVGVVFAAGVYFFRRRK